MTAHYCHNCSYYRPRPDGVHCAWCLAFFYRNGRMPLVTDHVPQESTASDPRPAIDRLWEQIYGG